MELENHITALDQRVIRLRQILDDEPDLSDSQRARLRQQIFEAENSINELGRQLVLCRSDITIVGVERTQGIQYFSLNGQGSGYAPDNSVPLIAMRALILRVYADCKRAHRQAPEHLPIRLSGQVTVDRIAADGSLKRVKVLNPINGSIAARDSASIDRGEPNHTLNFRVPGADCQGHLRFTVLVFEQAPVVAETRLRAGNPARTASIDPRAAEPFAAVHGVSAEGPPSFSLDVHARFEPVPTFRVNGVLVHYTGDGMNLPAPTGLDFAATLEFVMRTYPIGRIEFGDCLTLEFDKNLRTPGGGCGPGFEGEDGLLKVLERIDQNTDEPAIHVALIPRGARTSVGGCGNTWVAAAKEGEGETLAQEMGHALRRKHAPAGGAGGPDPDYPIYHGYQPGSIGEYGFDIVTSDVHNPVFTTDFMGYADPTWVSPYTYMGLRDGMLERFGGQARNDRSLLNAPSHETLHLSFRVDRDGAVAVGHGLHLRTHAQTPDRDASSDVCCELLDKDGEVLTFHRCRLRGLHTDSDAPEIDFNEAMPWIEDAVAIRFLRSKELLHVHEIEEQPPDLRLPPSGVRCSDKTLSARWTCQHPRCAIRYMLRYSADGGDTWRVLAANLGDEKFNMQHQLLRGGERCVLQVVASSGIRTSVAESKPFAVPKTPRIASILAPQPGSEGFIGCSVPLRGGAFSPDFGLGVPEDTVWSSSLDGVLGRGLEVVAEELALGVHTITLTVPDGMGGQATASRSARVVDPG